MTKSKTTKAYLKKQERKELKRLDKEWAIAVKERDGKKCVICGRTEYLNSHHLIPREDHKLRHVIANGICLCSLHHRFSNIISAHKNPFMFLEWFQINRKEQYMTLLKEITNAK
ncbi:HNH endonuclease [Candidatus Dojkabacteria bacterium]|jgi:5-methylcytosine-specific restriction endonuclease McrA|nr:HNH endonuclease [Candidatus Dojkabacteria bacterium]